MSLSDPTVLLVEHSGKSGPYFYGIARGVDERRAMPNRVRKSIGAEDTFHQIFTPLSRPVKGFSR